MRNALSLILRCGLFWLIAGAAFPAFGAADFLPVKAAYRYATAVEAGRVVIRYEIADGYYLYRDRLGFETTTPGVQLGKPSLPVGVDHEDEYFGKQVVYRDTAVIGVPVTFAGAPRDFDLKLKLQGCADAGLCYPPQNWPIRIVWPKNTAQASQQGIDAANLADTTSTPRAADTPTAAAAGKNSGFNLRKLLGAGAKSDADFLPEQQAFVFSTTSPGRDRAQLRWDIADDYYLYRDKVKVMTPAPGVRLGAPTIPGGKTKHDEYFGDQTVFYGEMVADVSIAAPPGTSEVPLEITYQGCADAGLCYPPLKRSVVVKLGADGGTGSVSAVNDAKVSGASERVLRSEQDLLADKIRSGNLLAVLFTFFGAGLLLALTPCVLPMVPILSGIIVGAGGDKPVTRGRAFSLSVAYVLGMALTYTVAGAAFAAAGQQAQAVFQKPWIVVVFAGLFVWLALGMFGLYNIQMPAWLQARVATLSNKQQQGTLLGTAIMGALSSLIVTACVAPPLVASLAVIGQSGDVVRGGAALFALSLGMGAPLLLVGASAGQFLPRAGAWMDGVKQVFGVMLLGVAIWMIGRLLPGAVVLALWAALAFVAGFCLLTMGSGDLRSGSTAVRRGIGALGLVYGTLLLIGALAGRSDPLQPLAGLGGLFGNPGSRLAAAEPSGLAFTRIKSVQDFERQLAAAQAAGRPVMLDFYADWCVSCKEMEKDTFTDAAVQKSLAPAVLLQADVTANDATDQALLQHFGILGPPTIVFYASRGAERSEYRVVGFKPAPEFAVHVAQAFAPGDSA